MIIPSADHLRAFVETLGPRDGEDFISITVPLAVLRKLAGDWLTDDSSATYTPEDVGRR